MLCSVAYLTGPRKWYLQWAKLHLFLQIIECTISKSKAIPVTGLGGLQVCFL
jgi:hypothetical protein